MRRPKILSNATQFVGTKLFIPQTIHTKDFSILCLAAVGIIILVIGGTNLALAQPELFQAHSLTADEIKNNIFAQKILSEIELFKKHISQIQQDRINTDVNTAQVDQNRTLAATLEQEALVALENQNALHTPKASFASFVSSINDTTAQNIFWGQFDYMSEKVNEGNVVMKQVLDNGGTVEEAIQAFSKYAAITRADMVRVNEDLNIQYGAADPTVQSNFNSNGTLPDNYIKLPNSTSDQ
ncbi:MAG: hypothetical protein KGH99_01560 [Thaumarchaeota archaeon]|nr:hypothetical protein [Nitrososphaerota archaeon]